jgi:hypothetical protein
MNPNETIVHILFFLVVLFSGIKVFSTNLKKSILYFLIEGMFFSFFLFSLKFYFVSFAVLFISAVSTYMYYYFSNVIIFSKEEESFYSLKTVAVTFFVGTVFVVGAYKAFRLGTFDKIIQTESLSSKESLGNYIYFKSPEIFFILSLLLSITPAAFLTLTGKRKA